MTTKLWTLAAAALVAWALKHHYATARADELWWILAPTAQVVGATTGVAFEATPGEGYVSRERLFVIEKSCAGVNFMIAAFAMLVLTVYGRITSVAAGAKVLAASFAASYGTAVLVNGVRITLAMWLAAHPPVGLRLTAAEVHRLEGIVVYFAGLLVLYEVALRIDGLARGHALQRWLLPLGCYYAMTIAVPLANGARGAVFAGHALAVLVAPLVLTALVSACSALARSTVEGRG